VNLFCFRSFNNSLQAAVGAAGCVAGCGGGRGQQNDRYCVKVLPDPAFASGVDWTEEFRVRPLSLDFFDAASGFLFVTVWQVSAGAAAAPHRAFRRPNVPHSAAQSPRGVHRAGFPPHVHTRSSLRSTVREQQRAA
jgi:hypothetical protein